MSLTLATPDTLCADPCFNRLKAFVIEMTGLGYYAGQDLEFARRLLQRWEVLGLAECGSYWELLHDPISRTAELDLLVNHLTIGETSFFRNEEQFTALRERVLPDVLERNGAVRRLRIWSAGCATGAEPYSLAIVLRQHWGELLKDWEVTILGTDINREFLAQACQARFGDWALRSTPADVIERCFAREGNEWLLREEFRPWVSFQHHNLVQHPFPSRLDDLLAFDLILCRNVMIYFSPEVTRRVAGQFQQCLTEDGWLLVGHAEANVDVFKQFQTVNVGDAVLYRNSGVRSDRQGFDPAFAHVADATGRAPAPVCWPATAPAQRGSDGGPVPHRHGGSEEAARQCQRRLAREPLNPHSHFAYAMLLQHRGQQAAAEQALRRTIYLDRKFILGHYYLGLLLERKGDSDGAKRSFRNTIRLLEAVDAQTAFADADGLDAAALAALTHKHLELLSDL